MVLEYNATLINRKTLYEGLDILTVKPDFPLNAFKAGQFATLGLLSQEPAFLGTTPPPPSQDANKMIRRAYSVASSPKNLDNLEFYIVLVPEGELTPRLFNLKVGAKLWMAPKITGKFILDDCPADKDVLMIATGTGVAPYMSMIRTHFNSNQRRKFIVVHGVRIAGDLGYDEELKNYARQNKNFFYLPMVSRPKESPDWQGIAGRINDNIRSGILEKECGVVWDPKKLEVFMCGNPGMIQGIIDDLSKYGFTLDHGAERGTLHKEDYW